MTKIKFYAALLTILSSALFTHAQTLNFKGSISAAKFQMTLTRRENKLSGDYFYEKQGSANKLKLNGEIQPNGAFTLAETDAGGNQTGNFKGTWKDDETSSGVVLEGTWQKPRGKGLGFVATEQKIYFTNGVSLASRKIAENNKLKLFEIDADYPEITGANSASAANFNSLAKQVVTKPVAEFRKDMLGQTAEDLKLSKERGMSNYMDIGYDVEYAVNDLVSIQFSNDSFEGGAHPNRFSFTLNYDLKNGRELALADLFQPKSNYLKTISDYCLADLKKQVTDMTDDEWMQKGAGANEENFRSWNITSKGLMINFDQYQVAAYAAGPQTVIIPYEKLKPIAKPDGVLANFVK